MMPTLFWDEPMLDVDLHMNKAKWTPADSEHTHMLFVQLNGRLVLWRLNHNLHNPPPPPPTHTHT